MSITCKYIEVLMNHIKVLHNCKCQKCEYLTPFKNIGCTKCNYNSICCKYIEVLMNHIQVLHNSKCQKCKYLIAFKNIGCTKCNYNSISWQCIEVLMNHLSKILDTPSATILPFPAYHIIYHLLLGFPLLPFSI